MLRQEANFKFQKFAENIGKPLIQELINHPERLSKDQQKLLGALTKQLIDKDITKVDYKSFMDPATVLLLNKADGLYEVNKKMQEKIGKNTDALKNQAQTLADLVAQAKVMREGLKTLTNVQAKAEQEVLIKAKEAAIAAAFMLQKQQIKEVYQETRNYLNIARGLGQLFGNSETARDI